MTRGPTDNESTNHQDVTRGDFGDSSSGGTVKQDESQTKTNESSESNESNDLLKTLTDEEKQKIIKDVIEEHGKPDKSENINHLAYKAHDVDDRYTIEYAVIDIKDKYFPDKKPSQEASKKLMDKLKSGNGISSEKKEKFKKDYPGVDYDDLCSRVQKYRQNGNNGDLRPIDDIELISKGFVSSEAGSRWVNNRGPVISLLGLFVECEDNGGS